MRLADLLPPDRLIVPLQSTDKPSVLRELAERLVARSGGDVTPLLHACFAREAKLSTGIGFGVAIPHGRIAEFPSVAMSAGIAGKPIPFDSLDGEPVRLIFLIAGPESAASDHVRLLSNIARIVRHPAIRARFEASDTPDAFAAVIAEAEAELAGSAAL